MSIKLKIVDQATAIFERKGRIDDKRLKIDDKPKKIDDKQLKIDDKLKKIDDKPMKIDDKPKTQPPPLTNKPNNDAFRRRKAIYLKSTHLFNDNYLSNHRKKGGCDFLLLI